tara:strand:+ start:10839 stop:14066 length:3228 start_codon:yes stop_codon:yes gene_type:complete
MKNTIFYISLLFFLSIFSTKSYGQDPNWSVNPSDFQLSMTFTTFLNVNGTSLTSNNDKVAAFVNGEIRGVANVTYAATAGKYVAYLSVYAHTNSEIINFRVYDSSNNVVVDIAKTASFRSDVNSGSLFQSYSLANPALNMQAILNDFNFKGITPNSKTQTGTTFNFVLPVGTAVSNLIPEFTNSPKASVFINQIKQTSGVSNVNFLNSKTYAVVSEDQANLKDYIINVNVAVNPSATNTIISSASNTKTNEIPVNIDVKFSNDISGFDREGVQLSNAVISSITKVDNQNFKVKIVPISEGDFSALVISGAALDANNKKNTTSNLLSFSYDEISPIITSLVLERDSGVEFFTITFNEEIINADISDFELTGSLANAYLKSSLISITSKIYRLNVFKLNNKPGSVFLKIKSDSDITDRSENKILVQETASFYLDNIAPIVEVYSPKSFSTEELSKLVLTFSETVFVNEGNIRVYKSSDDSLLETLSVTGANVSLTETKVTINLANNLVFDETYYVKIDEAAFKDLATNNYTGILNNTDWMFKIQRETDNYKQVSGAWSNTENWSLGRIPITTDNVFVASGTTGISDVTNLEVNNFTNLGTTEIDKTTAIIVNGNFTNSGILTINSDSSDSGVLLIKGSSTGTITYNRGGLIANGWSILAPPLRGQKVVEFAQVNENEIRINSSGSLTRYAVGYYNDANLKDSKWQYFDTTTSTNTLLDVGTGYTMSRKTNGFVSFTGTLEINDIEKGVLANQWTAIGNSFTAYYPINKNVNNSFLTDNDFKLQIPSVYIWDVTQGKYESVNNLVSSEEQFISPAQGFFIKSTRVTTLVFDKNKRTIKPSSGIHIFSKSATVTPFVKVFVKKGNIKVNTAIIYSETATNGFDKTEDIPNFDGAAFDINSHLVENSDGKNYTTQSLPKKEISNTVISLNLKAAANDEVVFSAKTTDFPADVKVYLEDRATNTFRILTEENSEYKITLSENSEGIGRFYLHTSSKTLSVSSTDLDDVSILKLNNSTLRITGLQNEKGTLKIYTILGQEVLKINFKDKMTTDIHLPNLKLAIYLVDLTTEKGKITKKIIIE